MTVTDANNTNCSVLLAIPLTDPSLAAGPTANTPLTTVSCDGFPARWVAVPGNTYEVDVAFDDVFVNILPGYNAVTETPTTTAGELVVTGLDPNEEYFYRVRDITCLSEYSNIVKVETEVAPPTTAQGAAQYYL